MVMLELIGNIWIYSLKAVSSKGNKQIGKSSCFLPWTHTVHGLQAMSYLFQMCHLAAICYDGGGLGSVLYYQETTALAYFLETTNRTSKCSAVCFKWTLSFCWALYLRGKLFEHDTLPLSLNSHQPSFSFSLSAAVSGLHFSLWGDQSLLQRG